MTLSTLVTSKGKIKIAEALHTKVPLNITTVAVGSGVIDPATATGLVDEQWRGPINAISEGEEAHQVLVHVLIPSSTGGYSITEIGLFDEFGDLIVVGKMEPIYKTQSDVAPSEVSFNVVMNVHADDAVTMTIHPTASATQKWTQAHVRQAIDTEHEWTQAHVRQTIDSEFIGHVAYFSMNTPPKGWLKANGALVSRTTYKNLFNAIGSTYGDGDGSTTFQLPDLRGEFIRGFDDSRGVDSGRFFGSAQSDNVGAHNHYVRAGDRVGWKAGYLGVGSPHTVSASGDTFGGPTGETRPRNIALLACIKY